MINTIKITNNWRVKRNWSNLYHIQYGNDFPFISNFILLGLFGFFLYVNYGEKFKKTKQNDYKTINKKRI